MSDSDTLAKALTDVRERLAQCQADYDRLSDELGKLRLAEKSLASIVEGASLENLAAGLQRADPAMPGEASMRAARGRGSRGPRANSAKGRLKALLADAGPQGLSPAEIARRLPDVAPSTLNAYLSMLVTSGEAVRRGDFITANPSTAPGAARTAEDPDADDPDDEAGPDQADAAE